MFGGLDHFLNDSFFTAHPRGTLILEHTAYEIDLFAAIRADAHDDIVFDPTATDKNTEPLMEFIRTQAVQYREPDLPADARILGLSTCSDASSNAIVIVFGLLTEYSESRPEDAADDHEP